LLLEEVMLVRLQKKKKNLDKILKDLKDINEK
jgi:hypothetical protein